MGWWVQGMQGHIQGRGQHTAHCNILHSFACTTLEHVVFVPYNHCASQAEKARQERVAARWSERTIDAQRASAPVPRWGRGPWAADRVARQRVTENDGGVIRGSGRESNREGERGESERDRGYVAKRAGSEGKGRG